MEAARKRSIPFYSPAASSTFTSTERLKTLQKTNGGYQQKYI